MASRILVVDDSPTIRRVVSAILERHGYESALASDGEDALQVLQSGEVKADLVLLDFVMPRMNGYQFCRALRADVELVMTPVVLMSAKSDRIRDQFVQQTGAVDAIAKPFDAQALVAVVENALRRVSVGFSSSSRLPEIEPEEPVAPLPVDVETRRTHVAQIIGTKLAHIVTRTMADTPNASPGEFAAALTERLATDAILEIVEVFRSLDAGGAGVVDSVLSGDLGVVPIGAVLQLLQLESQTGALFCRNGTTEVVASFRKGLIDLVQSSNAGDEFRLGRYFVEEGIVTPAQIDDVMQRPRTQNARDDADEPLSRVLVRDVPSGRASDPVIPVTSVAPAVPERTTAVPGLLVPATIPDSRRLLGATLLALGKITQSQLLTALTRQSSELLYEVLRWPTGRFDFRAEPSNELVQSAQLGLPVASVVMEGFRRVDEWRVLERTLGSFDEALVRDELALRAIDMGTLPSKEKLVLDAVDGERTVRAIIAASHVSSFDACRVLVQFLEARVLRRRTG